ncbi:hypothetical protein GNI_124550 [Gregarina niphandrodes]|uniref:Uncharacterized protein n=1 Tax=Gregarina niphandrodes TaxID=110365 RepID=A0A023B253_GRENI|nr:hypothetical protein GNI_124550 [Gregarina niphandrodes]EZG51420.1 hypothetical protein GNI_124550 [Gregarina niphandrodes]|eukprot:XP_011131975.1 hypothetical protein GNI_124550 [Gregarina niphandrodes]
MDDYLVKNVNEEALKSQNAVDGLFVSVIKAVYSEEDPAVALERELRFRNLFKQSPVLQRPTEVGTFDFRGPARKRLLSDFVGTSSTRCTSSAGGSLFHAEWNSAMDQSSFRLVSPRYLMATSSNVIVPLRMMLTMDEARLKVHLSLADTLNVTFRVYVNELFVSDEVSHYFGEAPWATVQVAALLQDLPTDQLRVGVIIYSAGEARRLRKGTDIDALPSMSNLLDDNNSNAIKEILAQHKVSCGNSNSCSPLAGVFTPEVGNPATAGIFEKW